ncbi:MAG: DUF4340 domain-containing protein [Lewinellaceae bacterium]|nr:DUF4340 domain-containing protein [Lewinellaceae bacterium]
MSKKFNNKVLLGVLAGLVVIFFLTNYLRDSRRKANGLPDELITLDTAAVETIFLYPQVAKGQEIKFTKSGGQWQVESGGLVGEANPVAVKQLLSDLQGLKPKRLAGRSKDTWEKYAVTDSSATRVKIQESGKGDAADLYIGKISYQQQPGGNPYAGNQGISGTTYVRKGDRKEVYAVDGFLGMTLNQEFSAWRKSDFLKVDKAAVNNLKFDYPEGTGFVVSKADSHWLVDGMAADSAAVEKYLGLLANRPERDFADVFQPVASPDYALTVSGVSMNPLVIQCWADTTAGHYFLHSSLNANAYFRSPADGLFKELFVEKGAFLK